MTWDVKDELHRKLQVGRANMLVIVAPQTSP